MFSLARNKGSGFVASVRGLPVGVTRTVWGFRALRADPKCFQFWKARQNKTFKLICGVDFRNFRTLALLLFKENSADKISFSLQNEFIY